MTEPKAVWITTPRLVLRRPRADDLDDYVRIHTDPRTYAHAPHAMPTPDGCRDRLAADLDDWDAFGIGYAAVVDRESGELIGWAGLRYKNSDDHFFNLYYRLTHDRLGQGLGREISRAVVAWGVEYRPEVPVTALVDDVNAASLATARSSGLVEAGTRVHRDDPPDAKPMILFEAPTVSGVAADAFDEALASDVLDLWVRVNDAGGSVGFLPGASRDAVRAALDPHVADLQASVTMLCVLRDPDGTLRGLGFWEHSRGFPYTHLAGLKRLMVDPAAQGRNLGRILLGGMVGIARRELPEVELLRLDYRDGLGLGEFYGRAGWTEVGRVPRGLKLSESDYRDDVTMVRRVDETLS
ncbi:GNAT family N-acetyltransferase [Actinopolymorpha alba]|uniref:GNAT family N-acetyltransferase n=1 Tax=Actinopolymorpha alba TaxID=533267 RepID=UPI00037600A7|nr:GNAT family N-acetyltransferase [Actinopolymorpha alba]